MKNEIPKTISALLTFAGETSIGAAQYGATLPLLHNTQLMIDADINALVDSIMDHGTSKTELTTRRDTVRDKVDTGRGYLTLGRDNWKPIFGSQFNAAWEITGFRESLEIPRAEQEVRPLLRSFHEFLAANPTFEVVSKEITADKFGLLFTQLETARGAVNLQEAVVGGLISTRDTKADALRKRMSDLIAELNFRMDGLDERWLAFGLKKPDAQETPEAPSHILAVLIGSNAIAMKWDAAARADYYRVFKKVHGTDTDYVAVGSPADLDFTLENLPPGSTIDIVVSAVNNGGESAVSEKVTIVMHA
jgi:hypothetical protein